MIVEELRKVAVDNLFTVGTFNKYWPTWQKEIKKIIGKEIKDITEDKILDLGSNLRKIFKSTGGKVRGQGEVSGGGYGWECLVAWYLNLCMANSRGIVFKFKKKLFPEAITDALTITYNRNEYLSETDILGFVFPDNENFINLKSSDQKNLIENFSKFVEAEYNQFQVTVLQCKTNWNDSSQIPFLYNLLYQLGGSTQNNVTIGKNSRNINSLKRFSYGFITVPSQSDDKIQKMKSGHIIVERVKNLTGGNYWGLDTKNGVASSIAECVNHNFSSGFEKNDIRQNIKNNISLLNSDLNYFNLDLE